MQAARAVPSRVRVPGYLIEEFLGRGAYGEVWRGRARRTGAAVALKRIPVRDPAHRAVALREAAVLSALDHPHLIRLHDTVRLPDAVVLVLDLAVLGPLQRVVAARGRLTPGEVVTAVAPVAAALAYAHRAGIVHGDVTPANILFAENGMPLLADLGMARLLGSEAPVRSTPGYVDPSLPAGDVPGPATDIFMIGGVALFALTGEPPWRGATAAEALAAAAQPHRLEAAERLRAAGVPDDTARAVVRALSPEPAERGTAAEFALELRASTRALAVELDAGRVEPLRPGGRHAAAPAARHVEPFTDGVRLPSPLAGAGRPRSRRPVIAAALVAATIAAAVAIRLLLPAHATRSSATASTARNAGRSATTGPQLATARSAAGAAPVTSAPVAAAAVDVAVAGTLLGSLDAARAAAFAAREPTRLDAVYASPALRARDRALLLAIVPPDCGLLGVRTAYREVRVVRRSSAGVDLRARASLRPARLVCGGAPAGHTPATRPADVRIGLVRTAAGYRIAWLQTAAG